MRRQRRSAVVKAPFDEEGDRSEEETGGGDSLGVPRPDQRPVSPSIPIPGRRSASPNREDEEGEEAFAGVGRGDDDDDDDNDDDEDQFFVVLPGFGSRSFEPSSQEQSFFLPAPSTAPSAPSIPSISVSCERVTEANRFDENHRNDGEDDGDRSDDDDDDDQDEESSDSVYDDVDGSGKTHEILPIGGGQRCPPAVRRR